jgi:hypothetical protein
LCNQLDGPHGCGEKQREVPSTAEMSVPTLRAQLASGQFIKVAVGSEGEVPEVGHKLNGCTTTVQGFRASHPNIRGHSIMLVDTPGFEDEESDAWVLEEVNAWLKKT